MTSRKKKGPKRDEFFQFVKPFVPLTQTQSEAFQDFKQGKNLLLCGYPGTGKTYIAAALAVEELANATAQTIRILRCSVATRQIGFLPGTEQEKMEVFERPYIPMFNELVGRGDAYQTLKVQHRITFESTSFLRGVTYDKSIIIVDEFQNLTSHEINTIVTRLGKNSRIIFCGDIKQSDVKSHECGFNYATSVIERIPNHFSIHEMGIEDIVRSGLAKAWIIASEEVLARG